MHNLHRKNPKNDAMQKLQENLMQSMRSRPKNKEQQMPLTLHKRRPPDRASTRSRSLLPLSFLQRMQDRAEVDEGISLTWEEMRVYWGESERGRGE